MVFQHHQVDPVLGRNQGSLQVGERLLETTLINDTFTSLVYQRQGQMPARLPGKVLETLSDSGGSRRTLLRASLCDHNGPWALVHVPSPTSLPATTAWDGHFNRVYSIGWTVLPTAPEGQRCHPTAHQDLGKNHWDIRETQELRAGDSQKCASLFSTTISAQTLLLPSSQPTSWPPARGSCRDITPWPSTSSTPGDAGCEEQSVTGPSTTSLPSAGQHHIPEPHWDRHTPCTA